MADWRFSKILLVTDGSLHSTTTEQTALNFAQRFGSSVDIINVIRKPFFGEKWLRTQIEETLASLASEKTQHLDSVVERFQQAGITDAHRSLLEGKSSDEITKYALSHDIDLVIRYRKGAASKRRGMVGQTAYKLLGICPVPVLLVAPEQPVEPNSVLACVDLNDDLTLNSKIVSIARAIKLNPEQQPNVLYCWDLFGHEFLKHRMNSQEYDEMVQRIEAEQRLRFDEMIRQLGLDASKPGIDMVFGPPQYAIPDYSDQHNADLVVMATVAPRSFGNKLLGSTVENTLHDLKCSILAIKPDGFESPLSL